jgi:hypothetical protein
MKASGGTNIRIHRDITGEMWFGVIQITLMDYNFYKACRQRFVLVAMNHF